MDKTLIQKTRPKTNHFDTPASLFLTTPPEKPVKSFISAGLQNKKGKNDQNNSDGVLDCDGS